MLYFWKPVTFGGAGIAVALFGFPLSAFVLGCIAGGYLVDDLNNHPVLGQPM